MSWCGDPECDRCTCETCGHTPAPWPATRWWVCSCGRGFCSGPCITAHTRAVLAAGEHLTEDETAERAEVAGRAGA